MAKLTLAQLERHLFAAADILRGAMEVAEYRDFLLALLFLKRVNDEFEAARDGIIAGETASGATREEAEEKADEPARYIARRVMYVPEEARWDRLASAVDDVAPRYLLPALDELAWQKGNERLRGLFEHLNFTRIGADVGTSAAKSADKWLAALISHFGSLRLRDEDLESPYALGTAYEYLLRAFADSAGAKGGEFHTPSAVVRMLVELARPRAGQRVYDPCGHEDRNRTRGSRSAAYPASPCGRRTTESFPSTSGCAGTGHSTPTWRCGSQPPRPRCCTPSSATGSNRSAPGFSPVVKRF